MLPFEVEESSKLECHQQEGLHDDRHEDMDTSKGPGRTTANKAMIGTSESH